MVGGVFDLYERTRLVCVEWRPQCVNNTVVFFEVILVYGYLIRLKVSSELFLNLVLRSIYKKIFFRESKSHLN